MQRVTVENGDIRLSVVVAGSGPLILCVHGWPELAHSWRHQQAYFAARGYRVAAMDVRGYGESAKPHAISAYTIRQLAGDVAAVIDALGDGKAILFGHDWGAPIVWNTALLHPAHVRAVAGLSVPYTPAGNVSFLAMMRQVHADRFFYQLYFQAEGVAEAEFEADLRSALRKTFFAISGDAPPGTGFASKGAGATFLEGMPDPQPFPSWLSEADLDYYVAAFAKGGMRGPFNRYRAQEQDFAERGDLVGRHVTQPSFFLGGERDPVRRFLPGMDLYANPGAACADFRGAVILPGIGHWVQQEAPDASNAALEGFLNGL
jgi:pimeloyl-ACP methyl ester carboxylesterase